MFRPVFRDEPSRVLGIHPGIELQHPGAVLERDRRDLPQAAAERDPERIREPEHWTDIPGSGRRSGQAERLLPLPVVLLDHLRRKAVDHASISIE